MPDRTAPPEARSIDRFDLIKARSLRLENGIPLHVINAGDHDILQIEILLRSGKWYESVNGSSYFASRMLSEGTRGKTSLEISELFESFGAQFSINPGNDFITLSVYFLNKFFKEIIPLAAECLFDPVFPEKELSIIKELQIRHIKVNNEKGSYLAGKEFHKLIFGSMHPYGRQLEIEDIDSRINPDLLRDYHSARFLNGMEILLTGKIDDVYLDLIEQHFGKRPGSPAEIKGLEKGTTSARGQTGIISKPGSLQSSLRYGTKIIPKSHPDNPGLLVLNELLGGFFGSRLMKNIREDKGYSYGIHSSCINHVHDSYLVISSDVIGEHTDDAIEEIRKEISRLRTELVSVNELEIVRNYMLGNYLSSLETSFAMTDKFKSVYFYGLDYGYYDKLIETIRTINPDTLGELALKYLNPDDFCLAVVRDEK
jgi:predicted Zn-dependent peptidase